MTHEEQLYQKDLIIQKLEQQLAEKDKEITELNIFHDLYLDPKEYSLQGIYKQLREQVCDEIIEKILTHLGLPEEEWVWYSDNYVGVSLIKEILDQIEKGE